MSERVEKHRAIKRKLEEMRNMRGQNFVEMTANKDKVTSEQMTEVYINNTDFNCDENTSDYSDNRDENTSDERLKNDDKLRVDVNSMLRICLDKNHIISKSLVNMLKQFIRAQIAMKFTSSKQVNNKFIMCNTAFFNCMKDVILLNRNVAEKSTSEKEILSSLGKILSNARDWDGGKREVKTITAISPTQNLTYNTLETITTPQTFFFIDENNQIQFAQSTEEIFEKSEDSG